MEFQKLAIILVLTSTLSAVVVAEDGKKGLEDNVLESNQFFDTLLKAARSLQDTKQRQGNPSSVPTFPDLPSVRLFPNFLPAFPVPNLSNMTSMLPNVNNLTSMIPYFNNLTSMIPNYNNMTSFIPGFPIPRSVINLFGLDNDGNYGDRRKR